MLFILFTIFLGMPAYASEESPLIVGMELSYPPFEMVNPEGKPAGISVEIAKALAKSLNRPLQIDNIPFIGLIPALKTDKIDLILSSMSITEERKESIDFSEPYLVTGLCLLVSKKSTLRNIQEANEPGRTIVVKWGTSGQLYALEHLPHAKVVVLDKEASCVLEVVQGKADAFIYDQFSVFTNWQKNLNTTFALLDPFQIEKWGIGIKKGRTELLQQVNNFIDMYKKEGGFQKLGEQFFSKQKKVFQEMGIPFVF